MQWDLSGYYQGMDDPFIDRDLQKASRGIQDFALQYENKVASLGPQDLFQAIQAYEFLRNLSSKPFYFAYLVFAKDMEKGGAFFQNIR